MSKQAGMRSLKDSAQASQVSAFFDLPVWHCGLVRRSRETPAETLHFADVRANWCEAGRRSFLAGQWIDGTQASTQPLEEVQ